MSRLKGRKIRIKLDCCLWQNQARPLPAADEGSARFREKQAERAKAMKRDDFEQREGYMRSIGEKYGHNYEV